MIGVIFVLFFIPIFLLLGTAAGKRRKAERARRLAEYRASPDSHLLHLD